MLYLPKVPPAEGLIHSFTAATPIHSLDISFDGDWAAGGGEGKIFLWNLLNPQSNYTLDSPALISAVQFSPQGRYSGIRDRRKNSKIYQVGVRELTDDRVQPPDEPKAGLETTAGIRTQDHIAVLGQVGRLFDCEFGRWLDRESRKRNIGGDIPATAGSDQTIANVNGPSFARRFCSGIRHNGIMAME